MISTSAQLRFLPVALLLVVTVGCGDRAPSTAGTQAPRPASEGSDTPLVVDGRAAYGEEDVEPPPEDLVEAPGGGCTTVAAWSWDGLDTTDRDVDGVSIAGRSPEELEEPVSRYLDSVVRELQEAAATGNAMDAERLSELEDADAAPNRFPNTSERDLRMAAAIATLQVQPDDLQPLAEASEQGRAPGAVVLTSRDRDVRAELITIDGQLVLRELSYPDEC